MPLISGASVSNPTVNRHAAHLGMLRRSFMTFEAGDSPELQAFDEFGRVVEAGETPSSALATQVLVAMVALQLDPHDLIQRENARRTRTLIKLDPRPVGGSM